MASSGLQVWAVYAVRAEESFGDAEERRGAVDGQLVARARALIPARHDEVAEVGHVIEVVVGEEELVDLQWINWRGKEIHGGAGAEVEDCAGALGQNGDGLAGAMGARGRVAGA